jgi:TFIIF-interacting CTD phosphatase-like protein
MYIQPRPYAREFLTACSEVFTLYVYTAGRKHYADAILDVLDTHRVIQKRFYRDSCVNKGRGLVKSLKKLPRYGE